MSLPPPRKRAKSNPETPHDDPENRPTSRQRVESDTPPEDIFVDQDVFTDNEHDKLDENIFDGDEEISDTKHILLGVVSDCYNRLDRAGATVRGARDLHRDYPWLGRLIKEAWETGTFKSIRRLSRSYLDCPGTPPTYSIISATRNTSKNSSH